MEGAHTYNITADYSSTPAEIAGQQQAGVKECISPKKSKDTLALLDSRKDFFSKISTDRCSKTHKTRSEHAAKLYTCIKSASSVYRDGYMDDAKDRDSADPRGASLSRILQDPFSGRCVTDRIIKGKTESTDSSQYTYG